jgi:hypothetical protein
MSMSDYNKKQIIDKFHEENATKRWLFRFLGWFVHYISIVFILYPVIFILHFIPIIGSLTAIILIFAACLCSLGTYVFLLFAAWIVARPVLGILLLVSTIGFIIGGIMLAKRNSTNQPQQQSSSSPQRRRTGFF